MESSDLIRDSKLETYFNPPLSPDGSYPHLTEHIINDSDPSGRQRVLRREEQWKCQRHIGEGSYGSVWLERCVKGGTKSEFRAVKRIRKVNQGYDRELEAFAKFSHSKYVRCFVESFGWYESLDAVFISMEYLEHGDLHQYLYATSKIPEDQTKEITYQLLEGLCFMHDNGFFHRDLKPRNVLLKSKPPGIWWVKIGDFGVSKRAAREMASSTLKGTPGFFAPELLGYIDEGEANDSESKAADIWALGESVHQMLTGGVTFTAPLDLNRYAQGRVEFPSDRLEHHGVSSDGQQFIRQLMAPTPKERLTAQNAIQHPWVVIGKDPLPNGEVALMSSPQPSGPSTNTNGSTSSDIPSKKWSTLEPGSNNVSLTAEILNNPSSVPTKGNSEQPTQDVEVIDSSRDVSNGNFGTTKSRSFRVAQKLRSKSLRSLSNFGQERRTGLTSASLTAITPTDSPENSIFRKNSRAQAGESQSLVRKVIRSFKSSQDSVDSTLRAGPDVEEGNTVKQSPQRLLLYRKTPHIQKLTQENVPWDMRKGIDSLSLSRYGEKAISITNYLITTGDIRRESAMEILDTERKDKRQIVISNEDIYEVTCSPNGRLAASRGEAAIVLWDMSTGSKLRTLHRYGVGDGYQTYLRSRLNHLAFSPDSRIVGAWKKSCIYGWDVYSGKQKFKIPLESFDCQQINTIAFLPSGEVLAAGVYSRTLAHSPHLPVTASFLVLFEADHQTPRYFHEIDIHSTSDSVSPLGLSTDSTEVAFFFPGYSEIGDIRFFDVSTGEPIWTLCPQSMTPPMPLYRTHALLTTPTVAILATEHYTRSEYITFLSIWDVQTHEFLASRVIYHGSEKACRLSFSRDGSTLVIGGEKGTIFLVRADFASLRGKTDTYGFDYMSRQERWLSV